jgi:membrane associated rhomboid family serine protease
MEAEAQANEVAVRPPDAQKTLEWITVLCAAGLEYRLSRDGEDWTIHVPVALADRARHEVAAYEADVSAWPAAPPILAASPRPRVSWSPLWAAGYLAAFHLWQGPFAGSNPLHRLAAADRERWLAGEWWRAATALTLHADAGHLLGNLAALALLGHAVCREMGAGVGWCAIVASGILGHALQAVLTRSIAVSVGASTACFGALGILTSLQTLRRLRRYRRIGAGRAPWLTPLAAGLGILAMLGAAPSSDLGAHLLGFVAGACLAAPFAWFGVPTLSLWADRALELTAALAVAAAWRCALVAFGAA